MMGCKYLGSKWVRENVFGKTLFYHIWEKLVWKKLVAPKIVYFFSLFDCFCSSSQKKKMEAFYILSNMKRPYLSFFILSLCIIEDEYFSPTAMTKEKGPLLINDLPVDSLANSNESILNNHYSGSWPMKSQTLCKNSRQK